MARAGVSHDEKTASPSINRRRVPDEEDIGEDGMGLGYGLDLHTGSSDRILCVFSQSAIEEPKSLGTSWQTRNRGERPF